MKLLIISTTPLFTLNLVRAAAIAGFESYVVTDRQWTSDCLSRHIRRRWVLNHDLLISGNPTAIQQINSWITKHGIDVVVPADTKCTQLLASKGDQIQQASLFPVPCLNLFDQMHNKWHFGQLLAQHQLPTPATRLLETPSEVEDLDLKFPVMIKPPQGENGQGIQRLDTLEALQQIVSNLAESASLPLLVQEWIPGQDIDLSLLANQGEMVAWMVQQRQGDQMHFLNDARVVELGRTLCRLTQYHGVAHIDMRIDDRTQEVKIIEFNPRFWGSLMFSTWMGVNFLELGLSLIQQKSIGNFKPKYGLCKYLGSSPVMLYRWIQNGFKPPVGCNAEFTLPWKLQMLDPLPEWLLWYLRLPTRSLRKL